MPIIPALWKAEAGGSLAVRSSRLAWPTWQNLISTKNTKKISRAWWHGPIIPVIREAEAGELLEPGCWRLQWAEIAPLLSSLGDRARLHLKKKITFQGVAVDLCWVTQAFISSRGCKPVFWNQLCHILAIWPWEIYLKVLYAFNFHVWNGDNDTSYPIKLFWGSET